MSESVQRVVAGDVDEAPEGETESAGSLLASISQAAEALGHHRQTIAKLIRQRGIAAAGTRRGHPIYSMRAIIEAERTTQSGELVFERLSPFERAAWLKSEETRLRIRQRTGELVERADVEQEFARQTKLFVQFIETLPDRLERDCGLTRTQGAHVEEVCNRYRDQLHQDLVKGPELPGETPTREKPA